MERCMDESKSAFRHFVRHFREEQLMQGISYENSTELGKAAKMVWKETPPELRLKFKNIPADMVARVPDERTLEEWTEKNYVRRFIETKSKNNYILDEIINIIDVNCYCQTSGGKHLIGECSLVRFSLRQGILNHYHILINPGKIPIGYDSDVKQGCKQFGLVMPDESVDSYYWCILKDIKDFVQFSRSCTLFTMPEKIDAVNDFIHNLCSDVGEDPAQFQIYKVDYLFYKLLKKTGINHSFTRELALQQLKKEKFKWNPGLQCKRHHDIENYECTTTRAKGWAFTILEASCPSLGVNTVQGKHLPLDFQQDLESLGIYSVERKVEKVPKTVDKSTSVSTADARANVLLHEKIV